MNHKDLDLNQNLRNEIKELQKSNEKLKCDLNEAQRQNKLLVKSEKSLLTKEKLYSLMENMGEGFYLFESKKPISIKSSMEDQISLFLQGVLIECNDAMAKMYGYDSANDLTGITLEEFYGNSEDPENIGFLTQWINSGYSMTGAVSCEIDKNGNPVWFSNNLFGIIEDGILLYAWGSQTNITEAKIAKEIQLREKKFVDIALNAQLDTFFLFDIDTGKALRWNKAFSEISGYTNEEIKNLPAPISYYSKEDLEIAKEFIEDVKEKGEGVVTLDLICKDGRKISTEYQVSVINDNNNTPKYFISIGRDITERKASKKQIEKELKEKEILLRELYHRTKNNMQVICSMLSLQRKMTDSDSAQIQLQEAENRIKTMSLVHKKLYKSNSLSNLSIKEYVKDLVVLIENSYNARNKDVVINTEVEDFNILIDIAIPIGLIINELLSNTFKHAFPKDVGEISIKIVRKENDKISIFIKDNGVGVEEKFDFYNTNTLGLQTVINIVENQLMGNVIFDSSDGLSCTIVFDDKLYDERV